MIFFFRFSNCLWQVQKEALDNRHNYIENESPNIWEPHVSNFKNSKRQDGQAGCTSWGTVCWWEVACLHCISTRPMWSGWWLCPAVHMCFPLTACMRRWLLAIGFFFSHMCNPLTRYACCRYILQGIELEFHQTKIQKKGKGAAA